jgi:hypothetical protein
MIDSRHDSLLPHVSACDFGRDTLERYDFSWNRHHALTSSWSMIFSDLPSPAEATSQLVDRAKGFAQTGNRYPLFGIML